MWQSADGRAVLGHRRLSVIDLAGGAQPMTGADARCAITFNGEIYNYRELRADLVGRGLAFRTHSDTEVLLRWYELEGEACLERLTGMFAFGIWDGRSSRLVLARDRLGKKPLYFAEEGGVLYFASTMAAVRSVLCASGSIDLAAVDDFLSLGFIPAPRSILTGVQKLGAGHVVSVTSESLQQERYWSASACPMPQGAAPAVDLEALDAQLAEAVAIRLRSDVPLGVFLSGGVDSSLITAYACREAPGLRTFSIAFGELGYDETEHAERVSRALGTRHRSIVVREELLDLLPEFVRQTGEPFADASALPLWILAREARTEITVALGGDGGDEGFGGYPWYRRHALFERGRRFVPDALSSSVVRLLGEAGGGRTHSLPAFARLRRALKVMQPPTPSLRFASLRVLVSDDDVQSWYGATLTEARASRPSVNERLAGIYEACHGDILQRMRSVDIEMELADGLMTKADVATMAHGLELRSPLLDHRIVQFGLSLRHETLKDGKGGKLPLRRLLERFLPRELFERPKQGFVVPLKRWFGGALRADVVRLPDSEVFRTHALFDEHGLRAMIAEHLADRRDHSRRIFNLLVLEQWLRQQ